MKATQPKKRGIFLENISKVYELVKRTQMKKIQKHKQLGGKKERSAMQWIIY